MFLGCSCIRSSSPTVRCLSDYAFFPYYLLLTILRTSHHSSVRMMSNPRLFVSCTYHYSVPYFSSPFVTSLKTTRLLGSVYFCSSPSSRCFTVRGRLIGGRGSRFFWVREWKVVCRIGKSGDQRSPDCGITVASCRVRLS